MLRKLYNVQRKLLTKIIQNFLFCKKLLNTFCHTMHRLQDNCQNVFSKIVIDAGAATPPKEVQKTICSVELHVTD